MFLPAGPNFRRSRAKLAASGERVKGGRRVTGRGSSGLDCPRIVPANRIVEGEGPPHMVRAEVVVAAASLCLAVVDAATQCRAYSLAQTTPSLRRARHLLSAADDGGGVAGAGTGGDDGDGGVPGLPQQRPSTDVPPQLARSRALASEGLEGLPSRASQLLQLGATFWIGPVAALVFAVSLAAFAALYLSLGDRFLHGGRPAGRAPAGLYTDASEQPWNVGEQGREPFDDGALSPQQRFVD